MFEPFPKIARLSRPCVITEKLDGTNAQVLVHSLQEAGDPAVSLNSVARVGDFILCAGSRNRWLAPTKAADNFGFAGWVRDNAEELVKLGPGRHFGEWYGRGIQRGYGLQEKRFALFNVERWENDTRHLCCDVVPTLYRGEFTTDAVEDAMSRLFFEGSLAAPGFMNPEGVIVYHTHARTMFKKTFDDAHKEAA